MHAFAAPHPPPKNKNKNINTSTHRHINTSTHQHIYTSTHQHINTHTHINTYTPTQPPIPWPHSKPFAQAKARGCAPSPMARRRSRCCGTPPRGSDRATKNHREISGFPAKAKRPREVHDSCRKPADSCWQKKMAVRTCVLVGRLWGHP